MSVWRLCRLRRFLLSTGTVYPGNIVSGSVVSARILSLEGYGVYIDSVSRAWLYYAGSAGWGVFLHGVSGGMGSGIHYPLMKMAYRMGWCGVTCNKILVSPPVLLCRSLPAHV